MVTRTSGWRSRGARDAAAGWRAPRAARPPVAAGYHAYLVGSGLTTNETYKWADLHAEQRRQRRARERERADAAGPDGVPGPAAEGAMPRTRGTYPLADATLDNAYNRGVARNVREVLFPPSLRVRRLLQRVTGGAEARARPGAAALRLVHSLEKARGQPSAVPTTAGPADHKKRQ
mgnify:CR=1 FL=1